LAGFRTLLLPRRSFPTPPPSSFQPFPTPGVFLRLKVKLGDLLSIPGVKNVGGLFPYIGQRMGVSPFPSFSAPAVLKVALFFFFRKTMQFVLLPSFPGRSFQYVALRFEPISLSSSSPGATKFPIDHLDIQFSFQMEKPLSFIRLPSAIFASGAGSHPLACEIGLAPLSPARVVFFFPYSFFYDIPGERILSFAFELYTAHPPIIAVQECSLSPPPFSDSLRGYASFSLLVEKEEAVSFPPRTINNEAAASLSPERKQIPVTIFFTLEKEAAFIRLPPLAVSEGTPSL